MFIDMKKTIIIIFYIFNGVALMGQSNYLNKLIKLPYPYFGGIYDIINTKDGNYYFTYDIQNLNVDSSFINLIKIDSKGDTIWAKRYGDVKSKHRYTARSLKIDKDDNIIITGFVYEPDITYGGRSLGFVLKTDKNGNQKWLKNFTDGSYICKLAETVICADGNYLFTGLRETYNAQIKDADYADPYIVKIDTSGNLIWQKVVNYSPYQQEIILGVTETKNKEYLMVGYSYNGNTGFDNFILKLNDKGQIMVYEAYGDGNQNEFLTGIIPSDDNNFIVSGMNSDKNPQSNLQRRSIITKINEKGERIWTKSYEEKTEHFTYNKLLKLPNGEFIGVGGQDKKPYLCGATKFDTAGNVKWHRSYIYNKKNGTSQYNWGANTTQDNGIIFCGAAVDTTTVPKNGEGWLLKLDSLGCDKKGCATSTATEEAVKEAFFSVYPNPSSDNITIQLGEENTENTNVKIINTYGTVLYKNKITANEKMIQIDMSNYAAGTYFVMVENEKVKGVKKVVVLK